MSVPNVTNLGRHLAHRPEIAEDLWEQFKEKVNPSSLDNVQYTLVLAVIGITAHEIARLEKQQEETLKRQLS